VNENMFVVVIVVIDNIVVVIHNIVVVVIHNIVVVVVLVAISMKEDKKEKGKSTL
jgi:hypothetical protein